MGAGLIPLFPHVPDWKREKINIWLAIAHKVLTIGYQLILAFKWRDGLFLWELSV